MGKKEKLSGIPFKFAKASNHFSRRTEQATSDEAGARRGGGGDAEDVVDLVDDHVPDCVDEEVLQQTPVQHTLQYLATRR